MRLPAFLLVLLAAGCAQSGPALDAAPPSPGGTASTPAAGVVTISGSGQFTPDGKTAIVYDRKLVPEGAQASVSAESTGGTTLSSVVVEGLLPNRKYGVHLHVNPCGPKPDDAGPHYQHQGKHADAKNEVWLDLKTDGSGAANASSRNDWVLDPDRLPRSLVIHAEPTVSTGPSAGTAGSRAACLTLSPR